MYECLETQIKSYTSWHLDWDIMEEVLGSYSDLNGCFQGIFSKILKKMVLQMYNCKCVEINSYIFSVV